MNRCSGSIQHGVSRAICYALTSSSRHVIKLPIAIKIVVAKILVTPAQLPQQKKDANHILIPQVICFFHICIKTVKSLVQI